MLLLSEDGDPGTLAAGAVLPLLTCCSLRTYVKCIQNTVLKSRFGSHSYSTGQNARSYNTVTYVKFNHVSQIYLFDINVPVLGGQSLKLRTILR